MFYRSLFTLRNARAEPRRPRGKVSSADFDLLDLPREAQTLLHIARTDVGGLVGSSLICQYRRAEGLESSAVPFSSLVFRISLAGARGR